MLKKLTAKVQKIYPNLPVSARGFSNAITVEPDDETTRGKKGSLYAVFDISGSEEFDTNLVSTVVSDVLRESYYQSENISPVQSLEKAIADVRDRVTKLTNESISLHPTSEQVQFNILCGVLWGNVIYMVSYGKTGCYLMRDGDLRAISANSEGHYSAASGVVKNDDVLIFATQPFIEKIPPEELLNTSFSTEGLPMEGSCVLLKIIVDTSFSQDEVVDFGMNGSEDKKPGIKLPVSKVFGIFKRKMKATPSIERNPVSDSGSLNNPRESVIDIRVHKEKSKKEKVTTIATIAGILLLVSVLYSLKINRDKIRTETSETAEGSVMDVFTEPEEKEQPSEVASAVTQAPDDPTVVRVSSEVFYDLKLTDASVNPSYIELSSSNVLVGDTDQKKIYSSSLDTPKFVLSDDEFKDRTISSVYLGNTYTLSGDTITKTTSDGTSSTWTQNAVLNGGRSISIDGSIYILKNDGSLLKFTQGVQDEFSVSGLDKEFVASVQVLTDYDFDYIYVADKGNNRIVVLDKEGKLYKQYMNSDTSKWTDIRGIAVTDDEKNLYVLDGSRVYVVSLTE